MSKSYHQTRKRHKGGSFSFVFDGDKKWKVKNKHKDLQATETIGKRKVRKNNKLSVYENFEED